MPRILDYIRSAATLGAVTPETFAAVSEARRELAGLRRREERAVEAIESYADALNYLSSPHERYQTGGGRPSILGAAGTANDRRGGKDLPIFWNELDLRLYRFQSRYVCEVNPFAIGFLGLLTDFHVRQGYGWQCCLRGQRKGAYDTGGDDVDPAVSRCQTVLDEFRDGDRRNPRSAWAVRSREAFRRWRRDGEVFAWWFRGGVETRGLPRVRFIDPARVGSPSGDVTEHTSFGVETSPDDVEDVRAYHLFRDDGTPWGWFPAERILHLTANVDSDVKRGVPDFFPVQRELETCTDLLRTMATVAGIQARIAWIERFASTPAAVVQQQIQQGASTQKPRDPFVRYGPGGPAGPTVPGVSYPVGSILKVDQNREFAAGPASTSVPGWVAAEQAVLRGCGARWRFPEYFSGDASNGTYASLKESGSPFMACVEGGQLEYGAFEQASAYMVLHLAAEAGRLSWADVDRVEVEVTPPKVVLTDKEAEARTNEVKVRNKVLSPQEWIQADGRDPKHTAENLRAWAEQFPDQGGGGFGGLLGGGGGPGPGGDGGGGSPTLGELLGECRYTGSQLRWLSEEGRAGLVKTTITNKAGKKQTVWVAQNQDSHGPGSAAAGGSASSLPPGVPTAAETTPAVVDKLAQEFPDEAKNPSTWAKVGKLATVAHDVIFQALMKATPGVIAVAENLLDTPDDMKKFGYSPTSLGTAGHQLHDFVLEQTGVPTHLFCSIATAVLSKAFVFAKSKLARTEADETAAAADWVADLLDALNEAAGLDLKVDRAAILAACRGA